MDWQPIETAPKDTKPILLCVEYRRKRRVLIAAWVKQNAVAGTWIDDCGYSVIDKVTHWMPLPEPPNQ